MKKIILFAAILFSAVTLLNAQTATDEVTVNVKLSPIQTLVVNSSQKTIDLEYTSVDDYSIGKESLQEDHLKVYSTGGFAIKVRTTEDNIKRANGDETIASSTLTVTASAGTNNPLEANYNTISLTSSVGDNLISSYTGGVDKNFNITYAGMGDNDYVNRYFKDETPTTYTATVVYTIVAN